MTARFVSVSILMIGGCLSAQIVSPVGFGKTEGNGSSSSPWGAPGHYMQIHGDLRGRARLFKGQSHRRDGIPAVLPSQGARTVEIEIWQGEGDLNKPSGTFARNYIVPRAKVFPKGNLNLPDWRNRPSGFPAPTPFDLKIPYRQPVAYTGRLDLIWEVAVTKPTLARAYAADAVSQTGDSYGTSTTIGRGCIASGRTTPMFLSAELITSSVNRTVLFQAVVFNGVARAPGAILVGLADPNLKIPGFCAGALHSDGRIVLLGRSDGRGTMALRSVVVPFLPLFPRLPGLFLQGVTLDPGQKGLPIAATAGVKSTIAGLVPRGKFLRIMAEGLPNATAGTVEGGFVLVTRFDP